MERIKSKRKTLGESKISNKTLIIRVSCSCNMSCSYCYVKEKTLEKQKVDFTRIKLALYNNETITEISLLGGEVFLYEKELLDFLSYVTLLNNRRDKKIHVELTTNGTIFIEDLCLYRECFGSRINISIDSVKDQNDINRKMLDGTSQYDLAIINSHKYKEASIQTNVHSTLKSKKNIMTSYLKMISDFPKDTEFSFDFVKPSIVKPTEELFILLNVIIAEKKIKKTKKDFTINSPLFLVDLREPRACPGVSKMIAYDMQSNSLYSCHLAIDKQGLEDLKIGTIDKDGKFLIKDDLKCINKLSCNKNYFLSSLPKQTAGVLSRKITIPTCYFLNKSMTKSYYKIPIRFLFFFVLVKALRR